MHWTISAIGSNRAKPRRRQRAGRGQSMLEFALAAPIFFLLLFGTVDMGMLFKTHAAYQEAAQEAVRVAVAAGQDTNADTEALNELQVMLSAENLTNVSHVFIFDATPGAAANAADVYKYDSSTHSFVPDTSSAYAGWSWPAGSRNTKATALDQLGIKITYNYNSVLGLIPPLQMTETASALMEPTDYGP